MSDQENNSPIQKGTEMNIYEQHHHVVTIVFKNGDKMAFAPAAYDVFEWKAYKFAGVDMFSIRTVDADDKTARVEHYPLSAIETVVERWRKV